MLSMNWMFIIAVISGVILAAGFMTSRNLPEPTKKVRIQKFATIGLALMLISFSIFQPFVPTHSETKSFGELKSENLNSIEEIIHFNKEQTRNIEGLKREVEDLRKDMYLLNRYYGDITHLLSFALIALYIVHFFGKEKSEGLSNKI